MKKIILGLLIVCNCLVINNYVYSQADNTFSEKLEMAFSEFEESPVNQIKIIAVGDKENIDEGIEATRCVVTTMTDGDLVDLFAVYYSLNDKVLLYDNKTITGDDFIVITTESIDFKGRKLTLPVYLKKSEMKKVIELLVD